MKKFLGIMFGLVMAFAMALSVSAGSIPADIEFVKVNGDVLDESDRLELERGEEFEIKVKVAAAADLAANDTVDNIEIWAYISGYEHGEVDGMSDRARTFDLEAGSSAIKKLSLKFPERADRDEYLLRIVVSDRNKEATTVELPIWIEPTDAEVVIKDLEISADAVEAGRSLWASVRVKNLGDSNEEDVKVKVSMPELGVSTNPTADYISELKEDKSGTSEFYIVTDACTKPGLYEVVAEVTFDEGDKKATEKAVVQITEGACRDSVEESGGKAEVEKTLIHFSADAQRVVAGGETAYPITISNSGSSTKAFMLSVDSADWATFRMSPSNLITVKAGDTQIVYVNVAVDADAREGEQVFTVAVKNAEGSTLKTLAMKADVAGNDGAIGAVGALAGGLVVLVVAMVVIGLVFAFRKTRSGEEDESQTYY